MTSFVNKKRLRVVITLATGSFGSSKNNVITFDGFRTMVEIDRAGGVTMSKLTCKVFGPSQSDMNSAVTLQFKPDTWIPNTIEVYAIDGAAESLIFAGNIINAWPDYQAMPDVSLLIIAQAAYFASLKPVPARSFSGPVDVASVMQQIARDIGYTFENTGVNTQINDLYLAGTGKDQALELAAAADCDIYIEGTTLAITPRNVARKSLIPLISSDTGLVGYPTFDGIGVSIKILYNPAVVFGGAITIDSDIPQANGQLIVVGMSLSLSAELPNGPWFSTIRANRSGLAITK